MPSQLVEIDQVWRCTVGRPWTNELCMPAYSPWLSVVTALFEISVAWWALRSPGRRSILRPVAAVLLLLAGYQLIEVLVCHDPGTPLWARAAFAVVVWLPPLGCLLVLRLAAPKRRLWTWLVGVSFAAATILTVWVLVDESFAKLAVCKAVIAVFETPGVAYDVFGVCYHFGMWGTMFGGAYAMVRVEDPRDRAHLGDIVVGNTAFVVVTFATELSVPGTVDATPSVMCHYALILALLLTRVVARERRTAGSAARPRG